MDNGNTHNYISRTICFYLIYKGPKAMTELNPEHLAVREEWREKIKALFCSRVTKMMEAIDDALFVEEEEA